MAYCKGAPDLLLKRCAARLTLDGQIEALDEAHRQLISEANASLAQQAFRVLGVAYRLLDQPMSSE
jgi:Ca2+-transporting ATPase